MSGNSAAWSSWRLKTFQLLVIAPILFNTGLLQGQSLKKNYSPVNGSPYMTETKGGGSLALLGGLIMDLLKRYSVFLNGSIWQVFDTLEEAKQFIEGGIWFYGGLATIWDNQEREYIYTEVSI